MARDRDPERSSVAIGDDDRKGGFPWWLLPLLALLIIGAIVLGLLSCGDDDKKDSASTPPPATSTTAAPDTTATTPPTEAPAAGAGTLVTGSQSLLGGDAAAIGDNVGETATGTGLEVLSLSENGFFVGTDDSDRQYVEFGGGVGADEAGSDRPQVGDTVDISGEIRPAPKSAGTTLKLSDADAQTVEERGSYVNADSVSQSAG